MQFITTLAAIILFATLSTAAPLPRDPGHTTIRLTAIRLTASSHGDPFNYMSLSAHAGALWLNKTYTDDTLCSNDPTNGDTPPPYATFVHDNATSTLRLYNGAGSASWQQVYVDISRDNAL